MTISTMVIDEICPSDQSQNHQEWTRMAKKLIIHRSDVFQPTVQSIVQLEPNTNNTLLGVLREQFSKRPTKRAISIVEIYEIGENMIPKLAETVIIHEKVTALTWIDDEHFLTVGQELNICIYNVISASLVFSSLSDYGPILCSKYLKEGLLLIGTEYGYVGAYKIAGLKIEPIAKMVKINNAITQLDYFINVRNSSSSRKIKQFDKSKDSEKLEQSRTQSGKRKRSDSSDESSTDEDGETDDDKFLNTFDIKIYGSSGGEVIAWDFHDKAIIDTAHICEGPNTVTCLHVLNSGDILVGDSTGFLYIVDHNSFACRKSTKILDGALKAVTVSGDESTVMISGSDPRIAMLRRSKDKRDEFIVFEKLDFHSHEVSSMVHFSGVLYTGSIDGMIGKLHFHKASKLTHSNLTRLLLPPDFTNKVKFSSNEMMLQYDKHLEIWKFSKISRENSQDIDDQNQVVDAKPPIRVAKLKSKSFIYASAVNDNWIAYSTIEGLRIFRRMTDQLEEYETRENLLGCNLLEFCPDGEYLIASMGKNLSIIDLKVDTVSTDNVSVDRMKSLSLPVVADHKLKANVKSLLYFSHLRLLIVNQGPIRNRLDTIRLDRESEKNLLLNELMKLKDRSASLMTYNPFNRDDTRIYVLTINDQIIEFEMSNDIHYSKMKRLLKERNPISGIPKDWSPNGIVFVSDEDCILCDRSTIYKLNLRLNRVTNQDKNFHCMLKMSNTVFSDNDQLVIAELKTEGYKSALPVLPENNRRIKYNH